MSDTQETSARKALLAQAEGMVKDHMSNAHCHFLCKTDTIRVMIGIMLARALRDDTSSQKQGFRYPDMLLVELVALFHDMADAKYAETSSLEATLAPFLTSSQATALLSEQQISLLLTVIPRISWSTEKKLRTAGHWDDLVAQMQKDGGWSELAVVQDADRLDAIGAFGVGTGPSYSSATNRPLYFPAQTANGAALDNGNTESLQALVDSSAIQHFHDKLLHIKDRMKTPLGKQEAQRRHETMLHFLQEIEHELAS
ncbi:hypothetical protein QFC20_000936 [Naganishia adeliensis]|uniref:Uncharacterized protein n=1 Tax=Naganishia adeliensis TaxID=92952 RepID=A0ACC2WW32_9TREE|nr:hypothetical protein QFC20_000936 [Naganishia adeliensis]